MTTEKQGQEHWSFVYGLPWLSGLTYLLHGDRSIITGFKRTTSRPIVHIGRIRSDRPLLPSPVLELSGR